LKLMVPGTKGKKTRLQVFDDALEATKYNVFRKDFASNGYHKLMFGFKKTQKLMEELGGEEVFGSWQMWGNTFTFRDEQKDFQVHCTSSLQQIMGLQPTGRRVRGGRERIVQTSFVERVNILLLEAYARRRMVAQRETKTMASGILGSSIPRQLDMVVSWLSERRRNTLAKLPNLLRSALTQ
jgi:hypothetical protein